jgi:hypothetical protein
MMDRKAFLGLVTLGYLIPAIAGVSAGAAVGAEQPEGTQDAPQHGGGMSEPIAGSLDPRPGEHGASMGNEKPKPGTPGSEPSKNSGNRHGGGLARERNPTPSRRTLQSGRDRDDWQIRAAVRRGDAEPLRKILSVVRKRYDGKVVRITLGGRGSGLYYRIRILGSDNRLIEVKVNARTASILSVAGL